jgi:hypothetical protein
MRLLNTNQRFTWMGRGFHTMRRSYRFGNKLLLSLELMGDVADLFTEGLYHLSHFVIFSSLVGIRVVTFACASWEWFQYTSLLDISGCLWLIFWELNALISTKMQIFLFVFKVLMIIIGPRSAFFCWPVVFSWLAIRRFQRDFGLLNFLYSWGRVTRFLLFARVWWIFWSKPVFYII